MDIWMTWCKRRSACAEKCGEEILAGTPMIMGKMWRKGSSERKWNMVFRWHPECWMRAARAYLEKNPYVPTVKKIGARGTLQLTDKEKLTRLSQQRRYGSLLYRYNHEYDIPRKMKLAAKMLHVGMEIDRIGGIPESWVDQLMECVAITDASIGVPEETVKDGEHGEDTRCGVGQEAGCCPEV